jgi:hypothetical protein
MINGIHAPDEVEALGLQTCRQKVSLKDLDIRRCMEASRIHMCRRQVDADNAPRWFYLIE